MSEEMFESLGEKAKALKLRGKSEVIRRAIHSYIGSDQPEIKESMVTEFKEWRKQLHNVGININQVAYKLNADHSLTTAQIRDVQEELQKEFKQLVNRFRRIEDELRG